MPKKAKKGGGAKGGGAKTEEERLLYLQQRAQAEEEMAKKKEEILTLFLKVTIINNGWANQKIVDKVIKISQVSDVDCSYLQNPKNTLEMF